MADAAHKGDTIQVGNRSYALQCFLGKGGFSEVFLGVDCNTRKRVALKIMTPRKKPEEAKSQLTQSTSEIKAMKQLNHPNLVRLLGYDLKCMVKGKQSIVMVQQLCPKGELFDYLMYTKKFEPKWAMALFHQLCSGLKHMHDRHIAHRDLKPENLLFDNNYVLKIADFGFSHQYQKKSEANPHRMRTELGTRGYMAPEILAPNAKYTEKADVFAAGVILFIMLAGFPPFQNALKSDWWFDKLMKGKDVLFWKAHERTAQFEKGAKNLLLAMMEPKESKRLNIDQVLAHKYVVAYTGTVSKEKLKEELKSRKSQVDKAKAEQDPDSKRDILMDLLQHVDLKKIKPSENQSLSLQIFLNNDFHNILKELREKSSVDPYYSVQRELTQALISVRQDDTQFVNEIRDRMKHVENSEANQMLDILIARETYGEAWEWLGNFFDSEILKLTADKLKLTCIGPIDDWDIVHKLSAYERGIILPQYPTGYCNAWTTQIGFGVLVYCVHTFAKNMGQVAVDKQENVITLTIRVEKEVQLPQELPNGELAWKKGKMNQNVRLELKLFRGEGENNILTIRNKTHFAMKEARALIEEITTNRKHYLNFFLHPFDYEQSHQIKLSSYHTDKDIDFLPESNPLDQQDMNSWNLGC